MLALIRYGCDFYDNLSTTLQNFYGVAFYISVYLYISLTYVVEVFLKYKLKIYNYRMLNLSGCGQAEITG
jgi:hypothetical protein